MREKKRSCCNASRFLGLIGLCGTGTETRLSKVRTRLYGKREERVESDYYNKNII